MHIVLFVDPEREMREAPKQILDEAGQWLALAGDWSEAARAIGREHPDLVVVDPHLGPDFMRPARTGRMRQRPCMERMPPAARWRL